MHASPESVQKPAIVCLMDQEILNSDFLIENIFSVRKSGNLQGRVWRGLLEVHLKLTTAPP